MGVNDIPSETINEEPWGAWRDSNIGLPDAIGGRPQRRHRRVAPKRDSEKTEERAPTHVYRSAAAVNPPMQKGPSILDGPFCIGGLVDLERFELSTSSMPLRRAPSCATGPHKDAGGKLQPRNNTIARQRALTLSANPAAAAARANPSPVGTHALAGTPRSPRTAARSPASSSATPHARPQRLRA